MNDLEPHGGTVHFSTRHFILNSLIYFKIWQTISPFDLFVGLFMFLSIFHEEKCYYNRFIMI